MSVRLLLLVALILVTSTRCSPSASVSAFQNGLNALADGAPERARVYFRIAATETPDDFDTWRLAGSAWRSGPNQSLEEAIACYRRALELRNDSPSIQLALARDFVLLGRVDEALGMIESLPDTSEIQLLRAEIELGTAPDLALQRLTAIEVPEEFEPDRLDLISRALEALGQPEASLAAGLETLAVAPLRESTHYRVGRLLMRRGRADEAQRAMKHSLLIAELDGHAVYPPPTPDEQLRRLVDLEADLGPHPAFVARRVSILIDLGEIRSAQRGGRLPTSSTTSPGCL